MNTWTETTIVSKEWIDLGSGKSWALLKGTDLIFLERKVDHTSTEDCDAWEGECQEWAKAHQAIIV
jgi:hypothetical protein